MEKAILILSMIVITTIKVDCQTHVIDIITEKHSKDKQPTSLDKKTVYFFTKFFADSSIFTKDTLILSKERINFEFPRIEFSEDSLFSLSYNVDLDTIRMQNEETGEITVTIIAKSEKINGRWKSDKPGEYIEIILDDDEKLRYTICKADNQIYFIKQ
jgi:hypothetical protein